MLVISFTTIVFVSWWHQNWDINVPLWFIYLLKKKLISQIGSGWFLKPCCLFHLVELYIYIYNTFLGTPSKFYFFVHVFNNVHPHSSTIFNMQFHISFTLIHMVFLHPCLHLCLSTLWLLVIHLINNVHCHSSTFLYQCP